MQMLESWHSREREPCTTEIIRPTKEKPAWPCGEAMPAVLPVRELLLNRADVAHRREGLGRSDHTAGRVVLVNRALLVRRERPRAGRTRLQRNRRRVVTRERRAARGRIQNRVSGAHDSNREAALRHRSRARQVRRQELARAEDLKGRRVAVALLREVL